MKTIQRLSAAATALTVTFSIVWGLANYAYAQPAEQPLVTIARR